MTGLDTRIDGLVIDKSGTSQTICQTNKNIIKPGYGVYMPYRGRGYMSYSYIGYRGLSIYRRILGVSHTETLNVSHNKTGGIGRGYIRDTKPSLLVYNKPYIGHMNDMRLYGLMV